jgi:hypothetical protein
MVHEIASAPRRPISSVDGLITNAVSCSFSLATDAAFWNPSRMHRSRVSAPLAAALLLASSVGVSIIAQSPSPTDFSGTWALAPPERAAGVARGAAPPALSAHGDMGSGWGSEITITQDDSALTVVYTYFHPRDMHPPFTFRYPLNGSAVTHTVNMGRGPQEQVSKASWRGAALAIATTHRFVSPADGQAMTSEMTQVLSLESPSSSSSRRRGRECSAALRRQPCARGRRPAAERSRD